MVTKRQSEQRKRGASIVLKGSRARRGFTLIEIMVVVAIITLLMAIGIAVGVQVKNNAAKSATNATLGAMVGAMNEYLKDHPEPPSGTVWVQALLAYPQTANILKSQPMKNGLVVDGYGTPIRYIPQNWDFVHQGVSATVNKPGFFWSYGPDGMPDGVAGNTNHDDMFSTPVAAQ